MRYGLTRIGMHAVCKENFPVEVGQEPAATDLLKIDGELPTDKVNGRGRR